jgi:hypothetical protein
MKRPLLITAMLVLLLGLGTAATAAANLAVTPDHPLYDTKTSVEEEIESLAPNETAEVSAKLNHAGK